LISAFLGGRTGAVALLATVYFLLISKTPANIVLLIHHGLMHGRKFAGWHPVDGVFLNQLAQSIV
jgi:hypothetical protein